MPEPSEAQASFDAAHLQVPADARYLALIGSMVRWFAAVAGLTDAQGREMEVAVDEACTNVVRYAFDEGTRGDMSVAFNAREGVLTVTAIDKGLPFDPHDGIDRGREKRETDPASGGMGLMLIQQLTNETRYCWDGRLGNQFTLIKTKESKECP